jgi:hypothetical protein
VNLLFDQSQILLGKIDVQHSQAHLPDISYIYKYKTTFSEKYTSFFYGSVLWSFFNFTKDVKRMMFWTCIFIILGEITKNTYIGPSTICVKHSVGTLRGEGEVRVVLELARLLCSQSSPFGEKWKSTHGGWNRSRLYSFPCEEYIYSKTMYR